jgi:hypothetical protein
VQGYATPCNDSRLVPLEASLAAEGSAWRMRVTGGGLALMSYFLVKERAMQKGLLSWKDEPSLQCGIELMI